MAAPKIAPLNAPPTSDDAYLKAQDVDYLDGHSHDYFKQASIGHKRELIQSATNRRCSVEGAAPARDARTAPRRRRGRAF